MALDNFDFKFSTEESDSFFWITESFPIQVYRAVNRRSFALGKLRHGVTKSIFSEVSAPSAAIPLAGPSIPVPRGGCRDAGEDLGWNTWSHACHNLLNRDSSSSRGASAGDAPDGAPAFCSQT